MIHPRHPAPHRASLECAPCAQVSHGVFSDHERIKTGDELTSQDNYLFQKVNLIAATAPGLVVATRNTADFKPTGVGVINPLDDGMTYEEYKNEIMNLVYRLESLSKEESKLEEQIDEYIHGLLK